MKKKKKAVHSLCHAEGQHDYADLATITHPDASIKTGAVEH